MKKKTVQPVCGIGYPRYGLYGFFIFLKPPAYLCLRYFSSQYLQR